MMSDTSIKLLYEFFLIKCIQIEAQTEELRREVVRLALEIFFFLKMDSNAVFSLKNYDIMQRKAKLRAS